MNYTQAMEALEETKKYGSQLGLDSIRRLMALLGNVQEQIPVVHIGGTNGKGSVGAMISQVLVTAGYRVGRFATPDVFSYEEEFLLDGVPIRQGRLAEIFTTVFDACQKLTAQGYPHPTRFEVETAAAFLWFYEEACDVALVEVGMGGATDATNVIGHPLLCILTSIGMDHMGFLGDTLEDIARVKVGILKHNVPVVTVRQQPAVWEVICQRAKQCHAPCVTAKESQAQGLTCSDGMFQFYWRLPQEDFLSEMQKGRDVSSEAVQEDANYARILLGLRGRFQVENALCALSALGILRHSFPNVTKTAIEKGMRKAYWPGRFEKIADAPEVYLDGAHNEDAVRKLKKTVDSFFTERKILYIMGVLADKDYDQMIRIMFRPGDRVFTVTPSNNPRAFSGEELARKVACCGAEASVCDNAADAVRRALKEAKKEDVILAFGSLSYLREIRHACEAVLENGEKNIP